MAKIINLTNFDATPEQLEQGVQNLSDEDKAELRGLLNFTDMPTGEQIQERASAIADIAENSGCDKAMISGAPYLMGPLENALSERGVEPVYAYSERVSVDVQNEDGSVTKTTQFQHLGFIEPKSNPDAQAVIQEKAEALADKAVDSGCDRAMIGGAPYLMGPLENALSEKGITPEYAFSVREVVQVEKPDGTVANQSVFKHEGFVEATTKPEASDKEGYVVNLTQHNATEDQKQDGVVEPADKSSVQADLTFTKEDFEKMVTVETDKDSDKVADDGSKTITNEDGSRTEIKYDTNMDGNPRMIVEVYNADNTDGRPDKTEYITALPDGTRIESTHDRNANETYFGIDRYFGPGNDTDIPDKFYISFGEHCDRYDVSEKEDGGYETRVTDGYSEDTGGGIVSDFDPDSDFGKMVREDYAPADEKTEFIEKAQESEKDALVNDIKSELTEEEAPDAVAENEDEPDALTQEENEVNTVTDDDDPID